MERRDKKLLLTAVALVGMFGLVGQVWAVDIDGDGVDDANDLCIDADANFPVDVNGCIDTDDDGITDVNDLCEPTPAGHSSDPNGCSDDDNDGVYGYEDLCLGTPGGAWVDAFGCELPDTDGDGVYDVIDLCPGSDANIPVDVNGCIDTDDDGITDANDLCEPTPAGHSSDPNGCSDDDNDGVDGYEDWCLGTPGGAWIDPCGCELPDTDGDGVYDVLDLCPGSDANFPVDENGCTDTDDDGVADVNDVCPDSDANFPVDAFGCLDTDGDGVPDTKDICPGTPGGQGVDINGCLDTDRDGVADVNDVCVNTPVGFAVDYTGCVLKKTFVTSSDGPLAVSYIDHGTEYSPAEFSTRVRISSPGGGYYGHLEIRFGTLYVNETVVYGRCYQDGSVQLWDPCDLAYYQELHDACSCPYEDFGPLSALNYDILHPTDLNNLVPKTRGLADPDFNGKYIHIVMLSDGDHDGVDDVNDLCWHTAPGAEVNENGCPDADGDGVADTADLCPGDANLPVNDEGCPDADGDGVIDLIDTCSGTPAGVWVDAVGCQILPDEDGDGVPDANDLCLGTPTSRREIDENGCHTREFILETDGPLWMITFDGGSEYFPPLPYLFDPLMVSSPGDGAGAHMRFGNPQAGGPDGFLDLTLKFRYCLIILVKLYYVYKHQRLMPARCYAARCRLDVEAR